MQLDVTQQELTIIMDALAEETDKQYKMLLLSDCVTSQWSAIPKGVRQDGINAFEESLCVFRLLIKLWELDKDEQARQEAIKELQKGVAYVTRLLDEFQKIPVLADEQRAEDN